MLPASASSASPARRNTRLERNENNGRKGLQEMTVVTGWEDGFPATRGLEWS